jgi:hypothetical protein
VPAPPSGPRPARAAAAPGGRRPPSAWPPVEQTDDLIAIETDALSARVRKRGYVSGLAQGSFVDKRTGARDTGFGLHIMDFLLAPGWRDDGYSRDPKVHGHLPKHYGSRKNRNSDRTPVRPA